MLRSTGAVCMEDEGATGDLFYKDIDKLRCKLQEECTDINPAYAETWLFVRRRLPVLFAFHLVFPDLMKETATPCQNRPAR